MCSILYLEKWHKKSVHYYYYKSFDQLGKSVNNSLFVFVSNSIFKVKLFFNVYMHCSVKWSDECKYELILSGGQLVFRDDEFFSAPEKL